MAGWDSWAGTFNGVVLSTAAVLPLAALAVRALARRRRAAGSASARRMSLAEVGIVYGTVPWVWMIMLPGAQAGAGLAAQVSRRWWRSSPRTAEGPPLRS